MREELLRNIEESCCNCLPQLLLNSFLAFLAMGSVQFNLVRHVKAWFTQSGFSLHFVAISCKDQQDTELTKLPGMQTPKFTEVVLTNCGL